MERSRSSVAADQGIVFRRAPYRFEPGWFADDGERQSRANSFGRYVTTEGRHRVFRIAAARPFQRVAVRRSGRRICAHASPPHTG